MGTDNPALAGRHVRLEPLDHRHVVGLAAAAAAEPSLYRWSPVPQGQVETASYVSTALGWRDAGTAVPFAIVDVSVRADDNAVIGSTRFWNLERWSWPQGHARHGRDVPDACEIGYTWLTRSAIRTAANTEAKLLMLTHARARRSGASVGSAKGFSGSTGWLRISSPAIRCAIRSWRKSGRKRGKSWGGCWVTGAESPGSFGTAYAALKRRPSPVAPTAARLKPVLGTGFPQHLRLYIQPLGEHTGIAEFLPIDTGCLDSVCLESAISALTPQKMKMLSAAIPP